MPGDSAAQRRLLGVDTGRQRMGLALSDPSNRVAQPLPTWTRRGAREDLAHVVELIGHHEVGTVVVGLPRLMSGAEGIAAGHARRFADRLRRLLGPDHRVELWDERLTSVQAERTMVQGRVRRDRRKRSVDALAAVLILQGYLDAESPRSG